MTDEQEERMVKAFEGIAEALYRISCCVDMRTDQSGEFDIYVVLKREET